MTCRVPAFYIDGRVALKKIIFMLLFLMLQKKKAVPGWKTAFFNQGLRRGYPFECLMVFRQTLHSIYRQSKTVLPLFLKKKYSGLSGVFF
jgi:hypothetical protein